MIVENAVGATARAEINANLQALASTSKGDSAPSTAYAGQHHIDDDTPSSSVWTEKVYDGTDWIEEHKIDVTNNRIRHRNYQASDVASASTIDLDACTGNLVDVTGTTTITAITLSQGDDITVRFTGALTLTNGASLKLPGAANITTAAGDTAIFRGYASGVVQCMFYQRASGLTLASGSFTNSLASDVTLASAGVAQNGPIVSQGTSGKWLVTGQVTVVNSSAAASFTAWITDGSTTLVSTSISTSAANANYVIHLSGVSNSPAGDLRFRVQCNTNANGKIAYNSSGLTKDSTINAVRIG